MWIFSFLKQYWKVIVAIAAAVVAVCSVVSTVFVAMGALRLRHLKPAPEVYDEDWVDRLHASARKA